MPKRKSTQKTVAFSCFPQKSVLVCNRWKPYWMKLEPVYFSETISAKWKKLSTFALYIYSRYFLKIQLGTLSILSGIKNQIDSIKTHLYIQKWRALTKISKKVIEHFDFRAWKWSSRAPKIKFSQYVNSRELKICSRIAMTLIFISSESWQSEFFKYVKIGAQNGAPE